MRPPTLAIRFAVPALLLAVWIPARTARAERPAQALARATKLFENGQDDAARAKLQALLAQKPKAMLAARAHVYLGLIALNAIDSDEALQQFRQAIDADPTVELPVDASPKAEPLFYKARRASTEHPRNSPLAVPEPVPNSDTAPKADAATGATPQPGPAGETAAPAANSANASHDSASGGGHLALASYVTGGVALAALGTGAIFWVLQGNTKGQITSPSTTYPQALALNHRYSNQYLLAEGFFWSGVGLAAVAGGLALFDHLTASHTTAAVAVSPTQGGAALNVAGQF